MQTIQNRKALIGKIGENVACDYLESKGYELIGRNYRRPLGEIDIICFAPDATLVFVEVKTMEGEMLALEPEDNLTWDKLRKLRRICGLFANDNQDLIEDERGWQIDLVAIQITAPRAAISSAEGKICAVRHYENI